MPFSRRLDTERQRDAVAPPLSPPLLATALAAMLAACTPAPTATGINDPYEAQNRRVHELNKSIDRAFVGTGAGVYGKIVPEPVRRGIGNVAANLDLPRVVVNDLLQGNVEDALHNSFRFLVNSTFGLAGLADPATDMGLDERDTDFGETLHVWGAREGAYIELPVLGPSTERDAAGKVVDIALNPLRYVLDEDERNAMLAISILARFGDRNRFSETINSILYDSADSYAQARLLYLQNRRFELGGDEAATGYDPYADAYDDPYADPNEDPYAQ